MGAAPSFETAASAEPLRRALRASIAEAEFLLVERPQLSRTCARAIALLWAAHDELESIGSLRADDGPSTLASVPGTAAGR